MPRLTALRSTSSLCLSICFLWMFRWVLSKSFSLLTSASYRLNYFTISWTFSSSYCSLLSCLIIFLLVYWKSCTNSCSFSYRKAWLSINSFVFTCVSSNFRLCWAIWRHSWCTALLPLLKTVSSFFTVCISVLSWAFCAVRKSLSCVVFFIYFSIWFISYLILYSTGFSSASGDLLRLLFCRFFDMFNDLLTRGFFDFGLEAGFGDILRLAPLKKLPMIGLVFMLEGEETID